MKVKVNFPVTNLQEFEAPMWWEARNWGREIQLSSGRWTPVCDRLWSDERLCVHFRLMIITIIMIVILAVLIMCTSHDFETLNIRGVYIMAFKLSTPQIISCEKLWWQQDPKWGTSFLRTNEKVERTMSLRLPDLSQAVSREKEGQTANERRRRSRSIDDFVEQGRWHQQQKQGQWQ